MRDNSTRRDCRKCGRLREPGELLSARGLCEPCGIEGVIRGAHNPMTNTPDWWQRWRRGMAASVGATLDDDR